MKVPINQLKARPHINAKENAGNRVSEEARRERVIDNNFSLCNSNGNSLTYLRTYTLFLKSNTFISNARLKSTKKIKQKLRNTLRLNFRYLKIIRFPHPRYHPKILGYIFKNVQYTSASLLMTLYD